MSEAHTRQATHDGAPKREPWGWPVKLAVGAGVTLLVLAAMFGLYRYRLHAQVEAALAPIRAAGEPVTLAELDAWYPVPAGRNAADVYGRAFAAYVEDEALEERLPDLLDDYDLDWAALGEPIPEPMVEAMREYVALNARATELLHEAGGIPECRYPVDLTEGYDVLLPHLASLRQGGKLLSHEVALATEVGDTERAVAAIEAMLGTARSLHREPLLISRLVQISLHTMTTMQLEWAMARTTFSDEQLARFSEAFLIMLDPTPRIRAMISERATGLGDFRVIFEQEFGKGTNLWTASGVADLDRFAYLGVMDAAVATARDPAAPHPDFEAMVDDLPVYCVVTGMLTPVIQAVVHTEALGSAKVQAALVGLATERYRLAHGELPERLTDLVPAFLAEVPVDPFDGKPMRYVVEEERAVVYSIGRDGVDDGGRRRGASIAPQETWDVPFTLLRSRGRAAEDAASLTEDGG